MQYSTLHTGNGEGMDTKFIDILQPNTGLIQYKRGDSTSHISSWFPLSSGLILSWQLLFVTGHNKYACCRGVIPYATLKFIAVPQYVKVKSATPHLYRVTRWRCTSPFIML